MPSKSSSSRSKPRQKSPGAGATKNVGDRKGHGRTGRPPVAIDAHKVETMASYGCTVEEIAAVLKCSCDTLQRRFMAELERGRNARNGMLRVKQFKLADKSATMAIFLGKNYLGQSSEGSLAWMTDDELLALAREKGIYIRAPRGATTPAADDEDGESAN
jgi:hypothetical protein